MDYVMKKYLIKNGQIETEVNLKTLQDSYKYRVEDGWVDEYIPSIDYNFQTLGQVYYDDVNKFVTYTIENKPVPTLEQAKEQKLSELKEAVKELYQSIQWYLELCRNDNITIPATLKSEIRLIRTKYEEAKLEIMSYVNVADVINWSVPYEKIREIRNKLDSII